jgi:hypothetical protein
MRSVSTTCVSLACALYWHGEKAANKLDEVPQEKWRGDNFIVKDPEAEEDALEIVEIKVGDLKADW